MLQENALRGKDLLITAAARRNLNRIECFRLKVNVKAEVADKKVMLLARWYHLAGI